MIKKLRRKFIIAAMLSVFAVLVLILGSITVANYANVKQTADERIEIIEQYGGTFPAASEFFGMFGMGGNGRLSKESPFDTRYFTVKYNSEGKAVSVNTGSIAAVNEYTALQMSETVLKRRSSDGFLSTYRYKVSDYVNGKLVIFVDSSRELASFRAFLYGAFFAGGIGLILVFVLVFFLSKLTVKPISESYEKQKRFITDASHEIKTPLAIINSANEVIEIEQGESEWTNSISNQVKRLSELTQKLITLSKMDEESRKLQKEVFNISEACFETAHSFDAVAQTKSKNYIVSITPDVNFNGEKSSIVQLISILLDNAMKYSDENGTVKLCLYTTPKNIIITVENTVDEIKKGNLNILFDRFYRSDASRSSLTGGSGIGLSVAKAIVTSHGGKISACSPDGKNIIITVTL